ncbi:hypothetical protein CIG75_18060 [Tumebacillus algifaecis]|uniref:Major facilitator superfamily (MFS) profile domain-containing protein n=1 Tax=Tumebacillus algifaecis TaxID=1214604 RepID=A0A223D5K1_9BACL|nr:MFS transporter [Tumebacillus algifaecis]ASS76686.1 hypothetical protein CIG75_18060 [Tumebacillus algifaecis]
MSRLTSFRCLWIGQTAANLADTLYIVLLIALTYQATQSAILTALIPIVTMSAQLIGGLLTPLVIDRFRLTTLLWSSQLGKTLLFTTLLLFLHALFDAGWLSVVLGLMAVFSLLDAVATPTRNGIVPRLVEKSELVKVNGWLASTDRTVQLAGWAMGGMLYAAVGATFSLWLCLGLHVLATLLMFGVRDPEAAEATTAEQQKRSGFQSVKEGWVTVWRLPLLRLVILMDVLEVLAEGVWIGAVMIVFVQQALGQDETWFGLLNAGYMAGMLLGGMLVSTFSKWVETRMGLLLLLGSVVYALLNAAFAVNSIAWLAVLLCLLMGLPHQLKAVIQQTLFQSQVSGRLLPKVFSVKMTVFNTGFALSALLMSLLTDVVGVRFVYLLAALLIGLATLLAWSKWKLLKQASVS